MSLGCVYQNGICSRLSQQTKLDRLNERDLSLGVSVAHNYIPGVDLNDVVFNQYGYVKNSTSILKDILDGGLRRLYLDVYWDTVSSRWHLCPQRPPPRTNSSSTYATTSSDSFGPTLATYSAQNTTQRTKDRTTNTRLDGLQTSMAKYPSASLIGQVSPSRPNGFNNSNSAICDYNLDFASFVEALKDYIDLSDTNIAASLILLHLRPKLWDRPFAMGPNDTSMIGTSSGFNNPSMGQDSLNSTLSTYVGGRILAPSQVRSDQNSKQDLEENGHMRANEEWPKLKTVLYTNTARLIVSYETQLVQKISDLQLLSSIAFPMNYTVSDPEGHTVSTLKDMNFTDTFITEPSQWLSARWAGVSPVLSGDNFDVYSQSFLDLLNSYNYWAWAGNQPILYSTQQREAMLSNGYKSATELAACAVFTENGMEVANCNSHFPVLCRSKDDHFHWKFTDDNHTYFDPSCPKNFEFATPSTPLQSRLLRELYHNSRVDTAWVDFNSLYLPNCWVTGGTNAVCPYNIVQDSRNGIGFIAAAAAVSFFGLLLIFLFEWDRGKSPLMRKNLKRDRTKPQEFEGVPS